MLTGLHTIPAAEAHLRQTVPAALSGRRCSGVTLVARIPAAVPSSQLWLYADRCALAIVRLDGIDARLTRDDGVAAAEALDRADPLLQQVERALGIQILPERVAFEPPEGALIVEIRTVAEGRTRDLILLALDPALDLLPAPTELAPELLGRVRIPIRVTIDGPRLAPHDAAGLETGDLLLLGDVLPARLVAGDREVAGRFDPAARGFVAAQSHPRSA